MSAKVQADPPEAGPPQLALPVQLREPCIDVSPQGQIGVNFIEERTATARKQRLTVGIPCRMHWNDDGRLAGQLREAAQVCAQSLESIEDDLPRHRLTADGQTAGGGRLGRQDGAHRLGADAAPAELPHAAGGGLSSPSPARTEGLRG